MGPMVVYMLYLVYELVVAEKQNWEYKLNVVYLVYEYVVTENQNLSIRLGSRGCALSFPLYDFLFNQ